MVFAMAMRDGQRLAPPLPSRLLIPSISSEKGEARGVVVQLDKLHSKLVDDVPHDFHDESGIQGVAEAVQTPPCAVIVEHFDLMVKQIQQVRRVARGPLADSVDRFA